MEPSVEIRTQLLVHVSIRLHSQMAELQGLRDAVRVAEAAARCQERVPPVIVAQPVSSELHV
jgi:hypothetical protein